MAHKCEVWFDVNARIAFSSFVKSSIRLVLYILGMCGRDADGRASKRKEGKGYMATTTVNLSRK